MADKIVGDHSQLQTITALEALCEGPRSQLDYMQMTGRYKTVMLSGVPQLGCQLRGWIKA